MKKKVAVLFLLSIMLSGCSCSTTDGVKRHIHAFDNTWFWNYEGHFHRCVYNGCQEKSTILEHDFDESGICTVCGYNQESGLESNGCDHEWSPWEILEEPTCTDNGIRVRFCNKCDKKQTRTIPVDGVDGHLYRDDSSGDIEPTCTTGGFTKSKYCERCGQKMEGEYLEPLGHDYEIKNHSLSKEATCEEDGVVYKKCKVCNQAILEVIPAIGHNYTKTYTGVGVNGVTTLTESLCANCNDHRIIWEANDVSDDCKNNRRLATPADEENGIEATYEPNYIENNDGSVQFWGRPIHNALVLNNSAANNKVYDSSVEGSFFEYKFILINDISNAELIADILVGSFTPKLFSNGVNDWTPGLIDSDENRYNTRYVVSLDGNVLEQDLSNDIEFAEPKQEMPRDWFTFPLKNSLNISSGTHTLRITMAGGYKASFYNLGFRL